LTADSVVPTAPVLPDTRPEVVDADDDYQIVHMMEGVIERGTGARARSLGRPLAGKTGTTNDSRDAWFIGFSPDMVAGVFVGFDQPRSLGRRETGASVALPGWMDFMGNALKDVPPKPFTVPPGIEMVQVDLHTGLPPMEGDQGPFIMEAFKKTQLPANAAPPENPTDLPVDSYGLPMTVPNSAPALPARPRRPDSVPFKAPQYEPAKPDDTGTGDL
jgi:penicillin-binding protein 1A